MASNPSYRRFKYSPSRKVCIHLMYKLLLAAALAFLLISAQSNCPANSMLANLESSIYPLLCRPRHCLSRSRRQSRACSGAKLLLLQLHPDNCFRIPASGHCGYGLLVTQPPTSLKLSSQGTSRSRLVLSRKNCPTRWSRL